MMVFRLAIYLLLIVVLLSSGCTVFGDTIDPQPPDDACKTGPEIAESVLETYDNLNDYSSTVTLTSDYGIVRERVLYQPPEKYRIDYLEPLEKSGDIVVFDGDTKWHYVNATNELLWVSADYIDFTFPEEYSQSAIDYLELVIDMVAGNEWTLNGTSYVNGQTQYIIESANATPLADAPYPVPYPIYSVRVWIEENNWIIRKAESFSKRGNPILTAEYSDVVINSGIPESAFVFHPPEEVVIKPMRTLAITPPPEEIIDLR